MSETLACLRQFHFASALARLALAMAAGGAVGYGRSRRRQSAGLRTYMLVSLGAALTVLISLYEYEMLQGPWAYAGAFADLKFDGSRFSAQVINGIGFLAAGTILAVANQQILGLTTAIGLFVSACLGIAAGVGFYECVAVCWLFLILTLEVLPPLETGWKRWLRDVTVCVELEDQTDLEEIAAVVKRRGARIFDVDLEEDTAILELRLSRDARSHSAMLSSLAELPCVRSVRELIS